jgi:hypothetical protein
MTIDLAHVVILGLAVYRLTRLVVEDEILDKVRTAIWRKYGALTGVGYLITCYWCTSFWVSSLVVTSYIIVPVPVIAISLVLALSAFTGLITAWLDRK